MSMKANPIAATLRTLADQLERGDAGWPFGDAEFSPPDELGRVRWRFVEEEIIPEFGEVIVAEELLAVEGGPTKKHYFPIPRFFHLRQTCGAPGSYSHWCAANASYLAPYNASRVLVPGADATILPLTYSSWEIDLAKEKRVFRQRCQHLRGGHIFSGFSGVSSDQDPGPNA